MKIKPGDVVRLKSGSPKMTVTALTMLGNQAAALLLWWSDANGQAEQVQVPTLSLVRVPSRGAR